MATRAVVSRFGVVTRGMSQKARKMQGPTRGVSRYFSDGKGRILSEEELAKETVYIQKMEKERMEKMKKKAEKEKAEREKEAGSEQKTEGAQKN